MSDVVQVCPKCDIAGCHHLRDTPGPKDARIAALEAERDRLRAQYCPTMTDLMVDPEAVAFDSRDRDYINHGLREEDIP